MYEDVINTNDEEEYYHGSYLKPVYNCEPCGLRLTTVDNKETQPCPMCGKTLYVEFVPLTFSQKHNYATISC